MKRVKKCLIALFSAFLVLLLAALPAKSPLREDILLPPERERSAPERVLVGGIDINSADAKTLEALPGIGEVLAQRIIDRREQCGPFRSVEELLLVDGIGEKTLENILTYTEE